MNYKGKIIDANVSLGFWPFQQFLQDTPSKMAAHLESAGISAALVSASEAVLAKEPYSWNGKLLARMKGFRQFIPVVTINPLFADWKERLGEYVKNHDCAAVKIFPGYHSYSLLSSCASALAEELQMHGIPLFIQLRIEDERTQLASMQVSAVDTDEIIGFASAHKDTRIACLCSNTGAARKILGSTCNVFVDISYIDGLNCLPSILEEAGPEKLLFGSHTPFLYTASSIMKLMYEEITESDRRKICSENILKLLGSGTI